MKKISLLLVWIISGYCLTAQSLSNHYLLLEEITFEEAPGVQSFVVGTHEGKWLVLGGRTDGLHRRQPWATFWESDNNKRVFVIDPEEKQVWNAPLDQLPESLYEQLQSTNMGFEQVGNTLYITGGYGFSYQAEDHVTYPYLTVVDIQAAIEAVMNGESLSPYFRQIEDARMQITGGYLDKLNDYFYLVGGQKFLGLYNPMGPNHGPGFVQEYSNQIRRFKILDDGVELNIEDYSSLTDSQELHRRDYNMLPQIFPDGSRGFTAFSGVFQYDVDLPWLNTVDIKENGYSVNPDFNQYLNQYHTAHVALYDSLSNQMHSLFFGGIGRYTINGNTGPLIDDPDVPFVKTISLVTRYGDGSMEEVKLGEMPALLGSGAEFILDELTPHYPSHIIKLHNLQKDTSFLGYVYGGIESSQPNIFFINNGLQSVASNRIFKVSLVKSMTTGSGNELQKNPQLKWTVFPNPGSDELNINLELQKEDTLYLDLYTMDGKFLERLANQSLPAGKHTASFHTGEYSPGVYFLRLSDSKVGSSRKIVIE